MSMVRPKGKSYDIANQIMRRLGRPLPKPPMSRTETQSVEKKNSIKKKNIMAGY